jgi:hypothetical protein
MQEHVHPFYIEHIVMCLVVHATKMTGSSLDDWIHWYFRSLPLLITVSAALSLIYTISGTLLHSH